MEDDFWRDLLHPAILIGEATGREKNVCSLCKKSFKENDRIVGLVSGCWKDTLNHTNRFCYNCFIKVLLNNFRELNLKKKK